ncbi:unnamed protein product [Sphacelaria rigidula]
MALDNKILAPSNNLNTNYLNKGNELKKNTNYVKKFDNALFNKSNAIDSVEKEYLKNQIPNINIGDLVKIGLYIKEGNKDRIQYYQGLIIGKNSAGINLTITVRKVFQGIGVERKFLIHSPKLESIQIIKSSRVRKSKLYYLRKFSEKRSRLKPQFTK